MRIALFADIHANREAFMACLAHARQCRVDRLVFLGDIVGYGADPQWTVDIVRDEVERGALIVRGNHDDAVGQILERMNPVATAAIAWTRDRLDRPSRDFLASLPLRLRDDKSLFVHASADAPQDWGYVRGAQDAERSLRSSDACWIFCGHTHVPALYPMSPQRPPVCFNPLPGRAIPLVPSHRWLAVIGAVGQPRDGDPAAAYALLDAARGELTMQRVPYDVERAARKVEEAGLPGILARRLLEGR